MAWRKVKLFAAFYTVKWPVFQYLHLRTITNKDKAPFQDFERGLLT